MYIWMAIISGIVVSLMNVFNGQLSDAAGVYISIVIIHICGLLTMLVVLKIKHISLRSLPWVKWFLYLGGVVGVLTVFFNNVTITVLGASLVTALALCGQILTSLIIEHFGWFQTEKQPFQPMKLVSLCIILVGIGVMLL